MCGCDRARRSHATTSRRPCARPCEDTSIATARAEVPRLKALPHLEMTTKGYEYLAQIVWLDFNLRNAPFNDKRFRQAVYHALDRNFIRDRIWFGLGKVATGPNTSLRLNSACGDNPSMRVGCT